MPTNQSGPSPEVRPDIRQARMRLLALAETAWLEECLVALSKAFVAADLAVPSYNIVRAPEAGLIMARGRIGNTGDAFNIGEVLVTRCVVSLNINDETSQDPSLLGYAWIMGEQARHAEVAALLDALWLRDGYADLLDAQVAPLLMQRRMHKEEADANAVAKTKVDFFTMVRGED